MGGYNRGPVCPLKPDDFIFKKKGVVTRVLGDQMVLAYPESEHPFRLNLAGSLIWGSIDRNNRIDDLIDIVHQSYDVDRGLAEADTISFLTELLEKKS